MFQIRQATQQDLEKICTIGAQTFTDAYAANNTKEDLESYLKKSFSPETISKELENPDTSYYLCYDNNAPIGYLKLNFNTPCEAFENTNVTELQRIYVRKEYYKHGAGSFMMQFAISICKEKKYDSLWLGVWKENQRALPFYMLWGFEISGERSFQVGSKMYEDYYLRKTL